MFTALLVPFLQVQGKWWREGNYLLCNILASGLWCSSVPYVARFENNMLPNLFNYYVNVQTVALTCYQCFPRRGILRMPLLAFTETCVTIRECRRVKCSWQPHSLSCPEGKWSLSSSSIKLSKALISWRISCLKSYVGSAVLFVILTL